jgi:hypothetical protein
LWVERSPGATESQRQRLAFRDLGRRARTDLLRPYSNCTSRLLNRRIHLPSFAVITIRLMGRYKFIAYEKASNSRYIVVYGLQWQIIDSQRIEPHADLFAAMTSAMQRLAGDGWEAENDAPYGFVFIRRRGERRLLTLTPRDPYDKSVQSFDPFKSTVPQRLP